MDYCIYKHTNKINGKVYIGKTCQIPERRYGSNGCGYKACPHFYNAIQKYGWNNFEHEILFSGLTEEEADQKEIECIELFDSTNLEKGYNIRIGGDGFNSTDSKKLWSNPEYAYKIKEANIARWKDEDYKQEMRNRMVESWKDEDKRARRSEATTKRWANEEFHRKAQSAVRESCKTSVQCVETGEIFDAIKDACEKYNIHHANLLRSIRKGYRSGGVHWKRIDRSS